MNKLNIDETADAIFKYIKTLNTDFYISDLQLTKKGYKDIEVLNDEMS